MAKRTTGKNFASPGQKYSGQVQIGKGPVPLERWIRPLTRAETDTPDGKSTGSNLRGEQSPHTKGTIPGTPSGQAYNRQSGRGR
jgi:hypothetical protein